MPLNITNMRRNEVKATAKRRAKRQKVVLLDDPAAPDKWVFTQSDGCSISHPNSFNNFIKVFLY
jgi:hypothetical protein